MKPVDAKNDAKSDKPEATSSRLAIPRRMPMQCPKSPAHTHTRVYATRGRIRHCVCDDCGETFKVSGDTADPLVEFARTLADSFEKAQPVAAADGNGQVVLIDVDLVAEIVRQLRGLTSKQT